MHLRVNLAISTLCEFHSGTNFARWTYLLHTVGVSHEEFGLRQEPVELDQGAVATNQLAGQVKGGDSGQVTWKIGFMRQSRLKTIRLYVLLHLMLHPPMPGMNLQRLPTTGTAWGPGTSEKGRTSGAAASAAVGWTAAVVDLRHAVTTCWRAGKRESRDHVGRARALCKTTPHRIFTTLLPGRRGAGRARLAPPPDPWRASS